MDKVMNTLEQLSPRDVEYCNHKDELLRVFNEDIAQNHEMTVLLDQGLYRHLQFRNPESFEWNFDLITWPGHLTIAGDIGTYTFARTQDMFTFFTGYINVGYWAEKIQHGSGSGNSAVKSHDEERFIKWVTKDFDDSSNDRDEESSKQWWSAIEEHVLDEFVSKGTQDECLRALQDLDGEPGVPDEWYLEAYEADWTSYDWHFELALAAIATGIRAYAGSKHTIEEPAGASRG